MTDYSKLTVVKLKEVLKERGLQVSGNKAALVTRLEENDAEAQQEVQADNDVAQEEAAEAGEAEEEIARSESPPKEDAPETTPLDRDAPDVTEAKSQAPQSPQPSTEGAQETKDVEMDTAPTAEPSMAEPISEEVARMEAEQPLVADEAPAVDAAMRDQEETDTRPLSAVENEPIPAPTQAIESAAAPSVSQLGEPLSQSEIATTQPDGTQISVQHIQLPAGTDQSSIDREEMVEDTKKRKRRSQSPVPDSLEVATKKAKALDGSPRVTASDDMETQDADANEVNDVSIGTDKATEIAPKPIDEQVAEVDVAPDPQDEAMGNVEEEEPQAASGETPATRQRESRTPPPDEPRDKLLSPNKQNAKFKGLFATTAPTQAIQPESEQYPIEDREVEPARHPATTALYIRNLMRPLQATALREHLDNLARLSQEPTEEEVIQEFYLDNIKTHCFVQFHSISAASRVRLALHERVWPDERSRKALWVDYIPEEKIRKWIEVERDASGSRGAGPKRFDVVYEKEGDDVKAYLEEGEGVGARGSVSGAPALRNGNIPTGPRTIPPPASQGDRGKGFKQLDELFKSTAAKPKLYFQPVSESIAGKRLDLLAAGRGGGRSDEMRRFSFEDALIVDKGPEFGSGWRGGARGGGRGGYGRGYPPRGGFRGDSWR